MIRAKKIKKKKKEINKRSLQAVRDSIWHKRGTQQVGEKSKSASKGMFRAAQETVTVARRKKVVESFYLTRGHQTYTGTRNNGVIYFLRDSYPFRWSFMEVTRLDRLATFDPFSFRARGPRKITAELQVSLLRCEALG